MSSGKVGNDTGYQFALEEANKKVNEALKTPLSDKNARRKLNAAASAAREVRYEISNLETSKLSSSQKKIIEDASGQWGMIATNLEVDAKFLGSVPKT